MPYLVNHMKSVHNRFPCQQCGYNPEGRKQAEAHMVRVHNMGMKGQRRYWKREAFLSKHRENVQSKVKTSSGESCDISRVVKSQGLDKTITEDRNKSERNKDMEPETIESNSTNFPCKDCSMVFKSYYRRKTHTNFVHLGIKYSCDQCEYSGSTKHKVKIHNISFITREGRTLFTVCSMVVVE